MPASAQLQAGDPEASLGGEAGDVANHHPGAADGGQGGARGAGHPWGGYPGGPQQRQGRERHAALRPDANGESAGGGRPHQAPTNIHFSGMQALRLMS